MKRFVITGVAIALACALQGTAWSHGGSYRGPTDIVPPNIGGGGGDVSPPGNPGGPTSGGPGIPTTGGRTRPGTGGGPAAGNGGVPNGRGAQTGYMGIRRTPGEGRERWEFWWEHNKEPFLDLKNRLSLSNSSTNTAGFLLGRTKNQRTRPTNRPTIEDVNSRLVPVILPLLEETHADVVDSAVLSLGRMLPSRDGQALVASLLDALQHPANSARQSAALALGVLGHEDAVEPLRALLLDTPKGRRLTGKPQGVEDLVRAFAAASLGMIGHSSAAPDLMKVARDTRTTSQDVQCMAVLALGQMHDQHDDIVTFLKDLMSDRSVDRILRAQAPIALGKLNELTDGGSPVAVDALPHLITLLESDKSDLGLLRSLAIAIGMLASMEDEHALKALQNASQNATDAQTRHFAMMALAQIGAKDTAPREHLDSHRGLHNFFMRELTNPKRPTQKPYGALALAIHARNPDMDDEIRRRSGDKLKEAFEEMNNPSYQGAVAISLGLLDFQGARDDLWEKYEDTRDDALRGYIAISLGLMRAPKGEQFRTAIATKGLNFRFRLQLSRALGLLGDVEAVPALISQLEEAGTLSETTSAAQALGLIGDRTAIDPLVAIANDDSKQPLARGMAVVALGILAEKTDLPWNWTYSMNSNYRDRPGALAEILDIL